MEQSVYLSDLRAIAQEFITRLDATTDSARALHDELGRSEFINLDAAAEKVRESAQATGLFDANGEPLFIGDKVHVVGSDRFGSADGVVRDDAEIFRAGRVPISLDLRSSTNLGAAFDRIEPDEKVNLLEQAANYNSSTGRVTKITATTNGDQEIPQDMSVMFDAMRAGRVPGGFFVVSLG